MKKFIALICIAGILPAFGQLVFSNQTITVAAENLAVESVEYHAEEVITNTVATWVETNAVYVGGPMENYATATNLVQQQEFETVIITNAATWICNVKFELPRGHAWQLNGFPVCIRRFSTLLAIPVDPATVAYTFGLPSIGMEFAASNGAFQPTGQVRDAFLSFAAAVLAGGQ